MQTLTSEPRHIVGICGSLRKHSHNLGLLRAFGQALPDNVTFTIADLSDIPLYHPDREQPFPEAVLALKELLNSADALVISSPEYNLSYTAVLKNAIEWLSRHSLQVNLAGKPVALMGAATFSVSVSQSHLRDVMFALDMKVINRPIVQVGGSREKFDQDGSLTDSAARDSLTQLAAAILGAID